jgi:hypothetical protein
VEHGIGVVGVESHVQQKQRRNASDEGLNNSQEKEEWSSFVLERERVAMGRPNGFRLLLFLFSEHVVQWRDRCAFSTRR